MPFTYFVRNTLNQSTAKRKSRVAQIRLSVPHGFFICFYLHPSDFHSFRKENSKTHLICDDVPLY
jgi:phosphatidylserine decarboxylase